MKVFTTERFEADYRKLPLNVTRTADRPLTLFAAIPGHPSLRLKKMSGQDIWEARLTRGYRMTLQMTGDVGIFRRVGKHNVLRDP